MKNLVVFFLVFASIHCFGQETIDLKTLIGKPQQEAINYLNTRQIQVIPSNKFDDLLIGFNEGIQLEIKADIVTTIWIEFTDRRTGIFPFQVDSIVTPKVDINKVIKSYGKPDKKGSVSKIRSTDSDSWVKWMSKTYQLHCEITDSKVIMVTIMEPNWHPGKED